MKPVMYHYVRPSAPGLPHFPYLSLADFERQLDHFTKNYGFVSCRAFIDWVEGAPAPAGVLLTFDDGLRDHVDFVLPALHRRGLFGIFYVSSGPVLTRSLLDVHKVHLAVGCMGGPAALAWLKQMAPDLIPPDIEFPPNALRRAELRPCDQVCEGAVQLAAVGGGTRPTPRCAAQSCLLRFGSSLERHLS